jgi:hypothetical protein
LPAHTLISFTFPDYLWNGMKSCKYINTVNRKFGIVLLKESIYNIWKRIILILPFDILMLRCKDRHSKKFPVGQVVLAWKKITPEIFITLIRCIFAFAMIHEHVAWLDEAAII